MRMWRMMAVAVVMGMAIVARGEDWPQWRGEGRDGVWRETGVVEKFPAGGPKVLWRTAVGGGYAGPAVAGGRVFVMGRLANEAGTQPRKPMDQTPVAGAERVVCLDEASGKVLWTYSYECKYTIAYGNGPRATPRVDGERVYALGAQGHLTCLNTANGEVVWEKVMAAEGSPPPTWGFASHPLVDDDTVYCLTNNKEGIVSAFDKYHGELRWSALPAKEPGYCPPMLFRFAGRRQLIVWDPESVNGLDAETGKVLWSAPFGPVKNGVSIVAPTQVGDELFVTSFWDGGLMLRPGKADVSVVWKRGGTPPKKTQALQSLMSAPFYRDGFIYGVCAGGQLRCIDARNGDTMWETMAATTKGDPVANATAFLVPNGEHVFISNDSGELIIAKLTPKGYEEINRAKVLEPTQKDGKRMVLWCHPAYADRSMFWRNDKEILRVDLSAGASEKP